MLSKVRGLTLTLSITLTLTLTVTLTLTLTLTPTLTRCRSTFGRPARQACCSSRLTLTLTLILTLTLALTLTLTLTLTLILTLTPTRSGYPPFVAVAVGAKCAQQVTSDVAGLRVCSVSRAWANAPPPPPQAPYRPSLLPGTS